MSGGTIAADGSIINRIGRPYTVHSEDGNTRITFDTAFRKPPVALATAHRGAHATAIVRVVFVDERSVLVTTRHQATNEPIRDVFSFMVLETADTPPHP
jgi:hypothetical protein